MDVSLQDVKVIKHRTDNEARGYCPSCGCDDCGFNFSKAVWHCFHCGERGFISGVKEQTLVLHTQEVIKDIAAIRVLYKDLVETYRRNLNPSIIRYLSGRGLTEESIERFKLGYCTNEVLAPYNQAIAYDAGVVVRGVPTLAERITIPYIAEGTIVDIRGRGDDKVRYKSLAGSYKGRGATCFFNHDIIQTENTLFITEGEFKAMVAIQHGYPFIATPGLQMWFDPWTALVYNKELIAVYDTDIKIPSPTVLELRRKAKILPNMKVAVLPRLGGEEKMDVDTFIITYGLKLFDRVLRGAIPVQDFLVYEARRQIG